MRSGTVLEGTWERARSRPGEARETPPGAFRRLGTFGASLPPSHDPTPVRRPLRRSPRDHRARAAHAAADRLGVRPARAPDAQPLPLRRRPPRAGLLAEPRRLPDPGAPRRGHARGHRDGPHPVHQQRARAARVRLGAARPKPVRADKPRRAAHAARQPLARLVPRRRLPPGRGHGAGSGRRAARLGHADAPRPAAPARARRDGRDHRPLRVYGPRVRRRPDGAPGDGAGDRLRDRAVVSAHGRLRRRLGLEHAAVPRGRASSTSTTATSSTR